jgi:putative transposase
VSFKTELKLNNKQKTLMAKHAGVARHAYNWGLATCFQA